jgi:hypothetical protein
LAIATPLIHWWLVTLSGGWALRENIEVHFWLCLKRVGVSEHQIRNLIRSGDYGWIIPMQAAGDMFGGITLVRGQR